MLVMDMPERAGSETFQASLNRSPHILSGMRVLDMSTGLEGSYCAKLLADYGARVIKIEPPSGEPTRREGPFPGDIVDTEKSGLFLFLNTSKEGITLDVNTQTELEILKKLSRDADVLVHSAASEPTRSMGLTYDDLSHINPRIVVTAFSNSADDETDDESNLADLLAYALTGILYTNGEPDGPPVQPGVPFASLFTGIAACFATLTAWFSALMTGYGQDVLVSKVNALLTSTIYHATEFSYTGAVRRRVGRWASQDTGVIESVQQAKDDYMAFVVGPGYERWRVLWEVMLDMPEVLEDERFSTVEGQRKYGLELEEKIQSRLRELHSDDLFREGQDLRLLFAKILKMSELMSNDHLEERKYFKQVNIPSLGQTTIPGFPWKFSDYPNTTLSPSPALGEHNQKVYSGLLGLSSEELMQLRNQEVI